MVPRRRPVRAVRLVTAASLALAAAPAWAGTLGGVTAGENPVPAGRPVTLTVTTTGSRCGVRVAFGDGSSETFKVKGSLALPSRRYPPGSYRITVVGESQPAAPACQGQAAPLQLVVQAPPPGTSIQHKGGVQPTDRALRVSPDGGLHGKSPLQRAPADDPVLGRQPGKITDPRVYQKAPGADPKLGEAQVGMVGPPTLQKAFHMPPPGGGIPSYGQRLVPGGKIELGGEFFGDAPGKVYLTGIPGHNALPLEVLDWNHVPGPRNSALVRIPDVDCPYQKFAVGLVLERTAGPVPGTSAPLAREFERPGETLKLGPDQPGLTIMRCGHDATDDWCNTDHYSDACLSGGNSRLGGYSIPSSHTIVAKHQRCSDRVGAAKSGDEYRVRLKNGWIIYEVVGGKATTSGDDWVQAPTGAALEALTGQTQWNPTIQWKVTPADEVGYYYDIWIKGPPGTRWF